MTGPITAAEISNLINMSCKVILFKGTSRMIDCLSSGLCSEHVCLKLEGLVYSNTST